MKVSQLEVGMGRASMRPVPARARSKLGSARPVVRYMPVTVKKFYYGLAKARARLDDPWAEHPFYFFFSQKLWKIQKNNVKCGPDPHEARARPAGQWVGAEPWIKAGNFRPRPARPATHGLGPSLIRYFTKPAGRARDRARPCPCPGLVTSHN